MKDLLKLLGTVQPGELQYGIQKILNPRAKLIEGAGLISMKTLKEYGEQVNLKNKGYDEKKSGADSLSFIKENQMNFNKKNNHEIIIDRNIVSSASFLQSQDSQMENNLPDFTGKKSLTINAGKLILKSLNTGKVLVNQFEERNDETKTKNKTNDDFIKNAIKNTETSQNMSVFFRSISGIDDKKLETSQELLSNTQNSLFFGIGKSLLNKVDEEYLKLISKNNK